MTLLSIVKTKGKIFKKFCGFLRKLQHNVNEPARSKELSCSRHGFTNFKICLFINLFVHSFNLRTI